MFALYASDSKSSTQKVTNWVGCTLSHDVNFSRITFQYSKRAELALESMPRRQQARALLLFMRLGGMARRDNTDGMVGHQEFREATGLRPCEYMVLVRRLEDAGTLTKITRCVWTILDFAERNLTRRRLVDIARARNQVANLSQLRLEFRQAIEENPHLRLGIPEDGLYIPPPLSKEKTRDFVGVEQKQGVARMECKSHAAERAAVPPMPTGAAALRSSAPPPDLPAVFIPVELPPDGGNPTQPAPPTAAPPQGLLQPEPVTPEPPAGRRVRFWDDAPPEAQEAAKRLGFERPLAGNGAWESTAEPWHPEGPPPTEADAYDAMHCIEGAVDHERLRQTRQEFARTGVTASELWGAVQAVKALPSGGVRRPLSVLFSFIRCRRERAAGVLGRVALLPDIRRVGAAPPGAAGWVRAMNHLGIGQGTERCDLPAARGLPAADE